MGRWGRDLGCRARHRAPFTSPCRPRAPTRTVPRLRSLTARGCRAVPWAADAIRPPGHPDALGVAEPTLARSGERRIIVELPGVQDPSEAAQVIGRTTQLTFHPVLGEGSPDEVPPVPDRSPDGTGRGDPTKERTLADDSGQPLRLGPAALTGAAVTDAVPRTDPQPGLGWFITIDFTGPGGNARQRLTGDAACAAPGDLRRRVAIVLDDQIISSPQGRRSRPGPATHRGTRP